MNTANKVKTIAVALVEVYDGRGGTKSCMLYRRVVWLVGVFIECPLSYSETKPRQERVRFSGASLCNIQR